MTRMCLRIIWHIFCVCSNNESLRSFMCHSNVEILSVFGWTCLDYTRPRFFWRTRFFKKKKITSCVISGRSDLSRIGFGAGWFHWKLLDSCPVSARWACSEPNFLLHSCFVKGMYFAPHIHEHFTIHKWQRQTAYIFTDNLNNLEHIANNCMNTTMHTDANIAQFWARRAPSVDAHVFIHRTCGSSLALCVIPYHPCMRTRVLLLEWSLLTRLSTSSSRCPSQRLMRSPWKIHCATPAWGAWSLWTMSHPSHVMSPRTWSSQTPMSWTSRPPAISTSRTPWTIPLPSPTFLTSTTMSLQNSLQLWSIEQGNLLRWERYLLFGKDSFDWSSISGELFFDCRCFIASIDRSLTIRNRNDNFLKVARDHQKWASGERERERERERKLGARNSCHGVASSLCPRERNLIHFWWSTRTSGRKHFPQTWNPRTSHTKKWFWFKRTPSFLDEGRTMRQRKLRLLRSRMEYARDREDGRKTSAAKATEDFGVYFSEGRLQVWTDESCHDPGWEAIPREEERGSSSPFVRRQRTIHL